MNKVEEVVIEYKEKTKNILKCLKENDFDFFYKFIDEREGIVEELKKMDLNQVSDEIKQQLNLKFLEDEINRLIKSKLQECKNEMVLIAKSREAHNAYNDHLKRKVHFNTQV